MNEVIKPKVQVLTSSDPNKLEDMINSLFTYGNEYNKLVDIQYKTNTLINSNNSGNISSIIDYSAVVTYVEGY